MIFTSFQIGKLISSTVAGAAANRFGRRTIMVTGVAIVSAAGLSIGFTPELAGDNIALLTILFTAPRFIQGFGAALAQLSITAILSDTFADNRGLIVGTASSMEALGYFIGPPIGGWLYALSGFRLPFIALAAIVALLLFPLNLYYPKTAAEVARAEPTTELTPSGSADAQPVDGERPEPSGTSHAEPRRTGVMTWRQGVSLLPVEVWWTCVCAIVYMSKWAWWEIFFAEYAATAHTVARTASVHSSHCGVCLARVVQVGRGGV